MKLRKGRPDFSREDRIFESPPIWSMYRCNSRIVISLFEDYPDRVHVLYLPDAQGQAEVYFPNETAVTPDPFYGPAVELLTVNHLSDGRGCILHGCGIDVNGSGILFAGESGAGKSTVSHLWAACEDATVLSDDRTIAGKSADGIWIYGTPWHGEAAYGSPAGCRLEGLFFLRQDRGNWMRPLSRAQIVQRLLTCSFPPLWDKPGMQATLDFFDRLSLEVPVFELGFAPDESIVKYIRAWLFAHRNATAPEKHQDRTQ